MKSFSRIYSLSTFLESLYLHLLLDELFGNVVTLYLKKLLSKRLWGIICGKIFLNA